MAFLTDEEMKLDEAQGISVDEIRMWLDRKGWNTGIGRIYSKRRNDGSFCYVSTTNELSSALSDMAGEEGMNLQGVLREINPRIRKGMPSQQSRDAHYGRWVASRTEEYTHTTIARFVGGGLGQMMLQFEDQRHTHEPTDWMLWSFWPCDENGNKVRWPVNAAGEML